MFIVLCKSHINVVFTQLVQTGINYSPLPLQCLHAHTNRLQLHQLFLMGMTGSLYIILDIGYPFCCRYPYKFALQVRYLLIKSGNLSDEVISLLLSGGQD